MKGDFIENIQYTIQILSLEMSYSKGRKVQLWKYQEQLYKTLLQSILMYKTINDRKGGLFQFCKN